MRYVKPWMSKHSISDKVQLRCGNCSAELMTVQPKFTNKVWDTHNYDSYTLELIGESDESQYHNYCGRCGTAVDWIRWEGELTAEDWVLRMAKGRPLLVSAYVYDKVGGRWGHYIKRTIEEIKGDFEDWDTLKFVPVTMENKETSETKVTSVSIIGTTANYGGDIVTLQGEVRILNFSDTEGETNQKLFEQAMSVDERLLEEWK